MAANCKDYDRINREAAHYLAGIFRKNSKFKDYIMTNQAQAVRDFIKASKERTLGEDLPMPSDETAWDKALYVAASRLDLDNLLDVVVKMGAQLSGIQFSCNKYLSAQQWDEIGEALALAQPYIDAVGER